MKLLTLGIHFAAGLSSFLLLQVRPDNEGAVLIHPGRAEEHHAHALLKSESCLFCMVVTADKCNSGRGALTASCMRSFEQLKGIACKIAMAARHRQWSI